MADTLDDFWEQEYNSPTFKHGVELGKSLGAYEAHTEALAAQAAGEIDLWLAYIVPKTLEEWEAWHAEHGDLHSRWTS